MPAAASLGWLELYLAGESGLPTSIMKPEPAPLSSSSVDPFSLLPAGRVPDPFQVEAMEHLMAGRSVVVCAPTGSGKTLIAEAASAVVLRQGERVFYTTPLKALSNQKFRDMGELFGPERCGLLTGDVTIRPEASLVVMTTEVFRNMLLRAGSPERLNGVRLAVLDECHYIGRWDRGTVWEEAILSCPNAIQLLALSATIPNAGHIAGWMDRVHPPTALVQSDVRTVPLQYYYCRGGTLRRLTASTGAATRAVPPMRRPIHRSSHWEESEYPAEVVDALYRDNLLPAIYFLFSRRGCETSLEACADLDLLDGEERESVQEQLSRWKQEYPSLLTCPFLHLLEQGLGAHHAGMMPAWKLAVERLFQQKLLKVVFATETLAAGINMPARSTVISSLRRPGDNGFRDLSFTEFHQMAGRAGRRGMDTVGGVIVLADPRTPRSRAQAYVDGGPEPLGSCFSPGYGLVIHWLANYGSERSYRLVNRGLSSYGRGGGDRSSRAGKVSPAWKRFMAARAVLDYFDLIEDDQPVGLGRLVAALQVENELLAALVLSDALPESSPPTLVAGIAGALAGSFGRRVGGGFPGAPVRPLPLRGPLRRAFQQGLAIAADLERVQRRCGFLCPTNLSERLAWIASRWADGETWDSLLESVDLEEGDVAYSLRSVIDILQQISLAPVDPDLRAAAAEARRRVDRPPVNEIL